MSLSEPRPWLIAYDVTEPRRLQKIHRFLKGYAIDVQYSVFLGMLGQLRLDAVVRGLSGLIEAEEDDVRIYPIPQRCEAVSLGRQVLPEGVLLAGSELAALLSHGHGAGPQYNREAIDAVEITWKPERSV